MAQVRRSGAKLQMVYPTTRRPKDWTKQGNVPLYATDLLPVEEPEDTAARVASIIAIELSDQLNLRH